MKALLALLCTSLVGASFTFASAERIPRATGGNRRKLRSGV